jgi:hypothetical protein
MSTFEQIIYRAPSGPHGMILQAAASVADPGARELWLRRLDPWLRVGGPQGRGYLHFGAQSALIRWHDVSSSGMAWQFAHVVVGGKDLLTGAFALRVRPLPAKLPVLPQDGRPLQPVNADRVLLSPWEATESRARSKNAIDLLVPILARVLSGAQSVTMPWTEGSLPEAAVWGLVSIMEMLGDTRPLSFLTYLSGAPADIPGTLVSFRPGAAAPAMAPEFETAAVGLAASYADNPTGLRQLLHQHGVSGQTDRTQRNERVLDLWPRRRPPAAPGSPPAAPLTVNANPRSAQRMNTPPNGRPAAAATSALAARPGGQPGKLVTCPICLTPIGDWDALKRWTWDKDLQSYSELTLLGDIGTPLRAHQERGSVKRCPNPYGFKPVEHYLPADYGSFGPPIVLGFVGLTLAGKTHLLTSMVGAMQTGLPRYRIGCRALDRALHERFIDERVRPLLKGNQVLPGTQEGIQTFSDAFVMKHGAGVERPVIMFDVAGGDLVGAAETKKFLDIADGLFFVVDPTQVDPRNGSDETFDNVLDLLKSAGRLPDRVSAAVVLTKADLIRFDEPVTQWLRSDSATVHADEFLRESRDVYAFLHEKGATAWTLPYEECSKATLHFASSTGGPGLEGGVYPRGVSPRRVLRPLVAMLAMTGVLNSSDAGKVGI